MYQDTITLFNRKKGTAQTGDIWYPTVITGVNLNVDRVAILAKYGAESQDNAMLSIRYSRLYGVPMIRCEDGEEKPWMLPKEWDQTEDSLTFKGGTDFDFFWEGKWENGIVSDSEYGGGFYDYMNRTKDHVFAVSSVAQYSVIPHFEIMGR